MRYAVIARHQGAYPVRLMCRVLAVAPAGFYAWRTRGPRGPSARAHADAGLGVHVRAAYRRSGGTYGAPRVHRELRAQGIRVAKKRVARLMRASGLVGHGRRRVRPRAAPSGAGRPAAPNRLARRFAIATVPGLNRVWVSDLTYVPTREGWLYLAVVLDLASRRCVGWATQASPDALLVLRALRMALMTRRPAPGLVHHSDRGSLYACAAYQAVLAAHGAVASMSGKGDCWDNAVAESFFATLKGELVARHVWPTRAAVRHALVGYLETWYNRARRHSTLGYLSPAQFEAAGTSVG